MPSFFFAIVFSFTFVFTIVFTFTLINTQSFNVNVTRAPDGLLYIHGTWNFTLAAVDRLILGAYFLRHHQFDVSITWHLLISVDGEVQLPLLPSS